MNILFVNYGDFTTNSLNHIGGFANTLTAGGHACIVAVPHGKETAEHVPGALFTPALFEELLARPNLFPNSAPADVIHAWTPREGVRKFVLDYQRALPTPGRLIVHLEDNERFLLEAFTGKSFAELRAARAHELRTCLVDGLPHPLRHENFLRVADGITHIVDRLRDFVPAGIPTHRLFPGVDFGLYHPQDADPTLRSELGLAANEKVIVFTGSNTFANEPEMRELHVAVALLNQRGIPTRLVRTGFNSPKFLAGLSDDIRRHVLDLGFVAKARLPQLLALADVLVQPGRAGPFNDYRLPSKLPEFLAMGKPVVLPPTNLALMMKDDREAVFLSTGAPEEIAATCAKLFADPKRRANLGRQAAAFARQQFDLKTNTMALEEFYRATASRPGTADWTLARDPLSSETPMVLALPVAAAGDGALVTTAAEMARELTLSHDAELERAGRERADAFDKTKQHIAGLEAHVAYLTTTLEETRKLGAQHAANLEAELGAARNHQGNIERELQAARAHQINLEHEIALSRGHSTNVETLLASTREHIANLQRELAQASEHIVTLQREQGSTGEHIANLQRERALAGEHIATLQREQTAASGHIATLQREAALTREHSANLTRQTQDARAHAEHLQREIAESAAHAANVTRQLQEAAAHTANVERQLAQTTAHAGNVERTLASLQPRYERAEVLRQQAETLLRSARQQCTAFEQEIERLEADWQRRLNVADAEWQQKVNLAESNFHQSDREAGYYKRLLQQSYTENRTLHEIVRLRRSDLQERNEDVARREERLQRMQNSFSWQATAWLRFLRRKFVDPHTQGTPSPTIAPLPVPEENLSPGPVLPSLTFRYSVDYPQTWSFPAKKLLVRGWCLALETVTLKQIRATVNGTRRYPGVFGLKRLDVLAAMRELPQAEYSGWKIEVPLEKEDHDLVLEVGDDEGGWHVFFTTQIRVGDDAGPVELTSYERWTETFDKHTPESAQALSAASAALKFQPLISIVMPVYNTPEKWLVKAVDSVRAQVYRNWELCIADDASPQPQVRRTLEKLAATDARIKIVYREKNGHISAASNSALELATGEFVALFDHDDELAPHALHEVATLLNAEPNTDLIYSDEDKIDEEGHRHEPYFKPDWLPDLFHAQNFISHLTVYRTALVRDVAGFRLGYEGSQDWDLALRVVERISDQSRIRHIPKILYHWRAIPGSTALMLSEKNYPLEAARRALTDHFERIGQKIALHHVPGDHWRAQYPLPATPPLVSLVIPTRNGLKFLQRCVDSILEKTTYPNYEVVVVDNGSDDPATLAYLKSLHDATHPVLAGLIAESARTVNGGKLHRRARVLRYEAPFNYSAINNFAVAQCQGEVVGLLNNDLEVITPSWLDEMATQALRPGVGCVGAMLYYPNETVQHAGVIVGLGGVAGHAFRDYPRGTEGKFNRARLVQNYTAVTAACLVVRRSTYEQVGGLDETNLTIAFNDIDFCLKVRAAGYRNLWTPFAELYHHESVSRGAEDTPEKHERFRREVEYMLKRWAAPIRHDPAYNPNLTLEHTDFSLSAPPRLWTPHG